MAEGAHAERVARRRRKLVAAWLVLAAALALVAVAGGPRWLYACALAAMAFGWWCRPDPDPGRWTRGAAGEVATAQLLARLPRRYAVVHDRRLAGGRGNVDHVVIGPTGVWVVDSKVRRSQLEVRRGQVVAGGIAIDVSPAARQAARLGAALGEPVGAVVAVHGRGLRRRGKRVDGVLVVPARRLRRQLRRGRRRLSHRQVKAALVELDVVAPPAGTEPWGAPGLGLPFR